MATKFPPPPSMTDPKFQSLNRWLLDISSILNSQGTIDPGSVDTLPGTTTQVGQNTSDIAANTTQIGTLDTEVVTLSSEITTLTGQITTLNAEVAVLQTNPVVRRGAGAPAGVLGNVGDWYGDVAGAVGARVWIKTGVATWTAFPF